MRSSSIVLMLLLAPASLIAQTNRFTSATVLVAPPFTLGCPVALDVRRSSSSGLVAVDQGAARLGQGLQIHFRPDSTHTVVSASITVHGMGLGAHVLPASSAVSATDSVTETFELTPTSGAALLHASIWTKKISAVGWVELTRLVYTDGTTWQPTSNSRCTAAPSLVVLVDQAAARPASNP